MENSKLFNLNLKDFGKGLVVAVLVAVLTLILDALKAKGLEGVNWGLVLQTTITAAMAYLLKQFTTNSEGKLGRKEKKEEVK